MAGSPVFTLQPNPHWVIIDNFSKLPDGAAIYTYRSLDPSSFKPAFEDSAGQIPYTQPIVGFGNGTMPPIFWEFDPNNPTDTYYIRVYDSADPTTQQFLWDFDGLSGGGSGGGGGTVVTAYNIQNLLINGTFYRNIGNQATLPTFLTIAPGANAGFVGNSTNSDGSPAPDITFQKNNTSGTDQLNFVNFSPLGIHSLANDVTPTQYLNYQCTGAGSAETYKYVQFPISQGVQNLSAQDTTIKIFARCNSGNTNFTLSWRQFYGDGGAPSADQIVQIGPTITLTNVWQVFTIPNITPDATGKTLGSCGNDGLFLQIGYPLNATTNIDFIKPSVYLGNIAPGTDYAGNDQINALMDTARTGDTKTTLNNVSFGYVQANDGTIGDASSNSSALANISTFPLFNLIWSNFSSSQTFAPMYTSAGAPVSYGASAVADFTAHHQLSLTRNLGRVMAGALPVSISQSFTNVGNVLTVASTASFFTGVPVTVSGATLPTPLVAGTTYYAISLTTTTMSLASTVANAILGTAIVLTSNASGTVIVPAHAFGSFTGGDAYQLLANDLPPHVHPAPSPNSFITTGIGNNITFTGANSFNTAATTANNVTQNNPISLLQPTVYMNVFFKL